MSLDNPCYFCNDTNAKSPRTPDSQSSGKGFSIFKRRNSKGSSPRPALPVANPQEQMRLITSANLDTTATMAFGSPRGSFNSLGGFSQQSFELQPLMYRQHSSNSHSETFRERLGSCNETHSSQCPGGGAEHDDVFNASKSQRHHTLPSGGTRRHSFGNWAQQQHHQQQQQHRQLNTSASTCTSPSIGPSSPDEVPNMLAPRPPVISPNKFRGSSYRRRVSISIDRSQ